MYISGSILSSWRVVVVALAFTLLAVLTAPAASAWNVAECNFTGSNSYYGGNYAQALTNDSNHECDDLWAKVYYKVDSIWYWSSAAINIPGWDVARKVVSGADDADLGKHKATSDSGVSSSWKTSY